MIHHLSIPVINPAHVAQVLAEIWRGQSYPFPIHQDSYIVFEGNTEQGVCLEIYPKTTQMKPGQGSAEVEYMEAAETPTYNATHLALSVPVSVDEILEIAQREGWRAVVCDRGPGCFQVVELWIENCFLVELITPTMVEQYLKFMTPANWEQFLASMSGKIPQEVVST